MKTEQKVQPEHLTNWRTTKTLGGDYAVRNDSGIICVFKNVRSFGDGDRFLKECQERMEQIALVSLAPQNFVELEKSRERIKELEAEKDIFKECVLQMSGWFQNAYDEGSMITKERILWGKIKSAIEKAKTLTENK